MLLSDIVNVFIGLALTYATVAVIVSALTESLASFFNMRSATLLEGLKKLLNDPNLDALAGLVINHAAVNPKSPGTDTKVSASADCRPSYIAPTQFASALIDSIRSLASTKGVAGQLPSPASVGIDGVAAPQDASADPVSIETAVAQITDAQLKTLFTGMLERAKGDVARFHNEIATWFDSAMDRVSGDYKRWTQKVTLAAAFVVAVAFNVDSFHIVAAVWAHPAIAAIYQTYAADQKTDVAGAMKVLGDSDLPFGWRNVPGAVKAFGQDFSHLADRPSDFVGQICNWLGKLCGWAVTALAALFGAPFWFDTLQRFVRLGGTGPKPADPPSASTTLGN